MKDEEKYEKIMFCAYNSPLLAKKSVVVYITSVSHRNVTSRLQRNKLDPVPIRITLFRLANLPSCHCAEFWASGPSNWLLTTSSRGNRGEKKKNKSKDKRKRKHTEQVGPSLNFHILWGYHPSPFLYLLQSSIDFHTLSFYLLKNKERER